MNGGQALVASLVLSLLPHYLAQAPAIANSTDAELLLAFKATFTNGNSSLKTWSGSNPCSGQWAGVECDGAGNVVKLDLAFMGLDGTIPPLGYMLPQTLEVLYLTTNRIHGPLPQSWSLPPRLYNFSLGLNLLTGPLPSYSFPEGLSYFNLGTNQLTGTLPPDLRFPETLRDLTLDANRLNGTLPAQWPFPSRTRVVTLDSNQFTGTIPNWSIPSTMEWLNLCCQQLTGPVPEWSMNIEEVTLAIGFFNNSLSGTLPTWNVTLNSVVAFVSPGNPELCGAVPTSPLYYLYTPPSLFVDPDGVPLTSLPSCESVQEANSSNTVAIAVGVGVGGFVLICGAGGWIWWRKKRLGQPAQQPDAQKAHAPKESKDEPQEWDQQDSVIDLLRSASADERLLANDALLAAIMGKINSADTEQAPASTGASSMTSSRPDVDVTMWMIPFSKLQLLRPIGAGSLGRVYVARWNPHHTLVAVKVLVGEANTVGDLSAAADMVVSFSSPQLANLKQEASVMAALRHPNILGFLGVCTVPAALVSEYCPRGSLFDTLQEARRSPQLAAELGDWALRLRMAGSAAKGMLYLHSFEPPIVHRDLKSPNLLLADNWEIKVCDFGFSKFFEESAVVSSGGAAGNPRWLAPEVLVGGKHTLSSDVYAFGMIMYELLTWELPWADYTMWQVAGAVAEGCRPPIPELVQLPGDYTSVEGLDAYLALLQNCWAQSPGDRPPFDAILNELTILLESCSGVALEGQESGGLQGQQEPAQRPINVLWDIDVARGQQIQPSPFQENVNSLT